MPEKKRSLFFKRMIHAPFPYEGKFADSGRDFYDVVDPVTGSRLHTTPAGRRLAEDRHYRDNRVLFFIPPLFDSAKPFFYLLFFHGFLTTAARSVHDFRLTDQVAASKQNVIFIAPQLAVDAEDSSPGKFFGKNAFRAFMAEAAGYISEDTGLFQTERFKTAPIILSAFSGGYKSVACILEYGGVGERVRGVYLLDALYGDLDVFAGWVEKNLDKAFFSLLYTKGHVKKNKKRLAALLAQKGIGYEEGRPGRLKPGQIFLTPSKRLHGDIPLLGPPRHPLQQMLENLCL